MPRLNQQTRDRLARLGTNEEDFFEMHDIVDTSLNNLFTALDILAENKGAPLVLGVDYIFSEVIRRTHRCSPRSDHLDKLYAVASKWGLSEREKLMIHETQGVFDAMGLDSVKLEALGIDIEKMAKDIYGKCESEEH